GFVFGLAGGGEVSLSGLGVAGCFFLQALMYIGLAFFFGLLFRRSAFAMGLFCFYAFVLENVLERRLEGLGHAGELLPLAASDHLLVPGAMAAAGDVAGLVAPAGVHWPSWGLAVAAAAWVGLCLAGCFARFGRQDL
ncbi:MAG: hypothetical protein LBI96_05320, partial [Odoribacteraceae bacterium]|nr:hypothetical protein [Odoribacteraceae bacterium]